MKLKLSIPQPQGGVTPMSTPAQTVDQSIDDEIPF